MSPVEAGAYTLARARGFEAPAWAFGIATLPAHRGRGIGTATTARCVADGWRNGAAWAFLDSSDAGYRTYERMGSRTVEMRERWVSAG